MNNFLIKVLWVSFLGCWLELYKWDKIFKFFILFNILDCGTRKSSLEQIQKCVRDDLNVSPIWRMTEIIVPKVELNFPIFLLLFFDFLQSLFLFVLFILFVLFLATALFALVLLFFLDTCIQSLNPKLVLLLVES